jgi:hypothetical protein
VNVPLLSTSDVLETFDRWILAEAREPEERAA